MPKVLYKSSEVDNLVKFEFVEIAKPVFESLEIKEKEGKVYDIESQISNLKEELQLLRDEKLQLEEELAKRQELAKEEVQIESKRLIEEAKAKANEVLEAAKQEADLLQKEAIYKKESIETESNAEIERLAREYEEKLKTDLEIAIAKGREEGYSKGYESGFEDFDKVMRKLHAIIASLIAERKGILESSSGQIVSLVMQIAIKVIKRITDSQKDIVLENVNEVLKRVKDKTQITIRVNLDDLDIVRHKKSDFISRFDIIEKLEIIEDPNIGKGGCIIETNFGEIDARISSQLDKIEEKFKNFSLLS
ncbi:flagellar assembly protein FliH [Borreliella burgdorferi]|uniref:Flagellar assembly protein FliH n=1 Tax=Borreliella burgdorferi 118a TaxID=476210 RepID=A0A7U8EXE3_BORBG|nr:flagellar assembly protein FliH [Borreliella burgdorferi]ADQ29163.1 flagellar assembly protein FliH [Borreliella burgdorferi N40]EEE18678.1 flagellar assembly protein FliH [Borreliella burgdorferi 72a]EEF83343.1 flagellar assembly protein FliH [Borreliella burgdorferi CA-11.2A]EEG98700.1 flagellar assembly protein FliH [Borreliella burgdorferi 118a]EEH32730.1 flagellar assembly protein FliH [Borreliella burgdorferi 29805]